MAHYIRMLGSFLRDCFIADGWLPTYRGRGSGTSANLPPTKVILKKAGFQSITLSLLRPLPPDEVENFCRRAGISAEKLAELRSQVSSS